MTEIDSPTELQSVEAGISAWRPLLLKFADELIPADLDGFPPAGSVMARSEKAVERIIRARGDLCRSAPLLPRADDLDGLTVSDLPPEVADQLRQFVAGVYFSDSEVLLQLGYTGQTAQSLPDIRRSLEELADLLHERAAFRPG